MGDRYKHEFLDKCPFCGKYPEMVRTEITFNMEVPEYRYKVECDCGIEQGYTFRSEEEAVDDWNRRSDD